MSHVVTGRIARAGLSGFQQVIKPSALKRPELNFNQIFMFEYQFRINPGEIEAAFTLHALFEHRGDVAQQIRKGIDGIRWKLTYRLATTAPPNHLEYRDQFFRGAFGWSERHDELLEDSFAKL